MDQGHLMSLFAQFLEYTGKGQGKGMGGMMGSPMAWQQNSGGNGRKRKMVDESGGVEGTFIGTIRSFHDRSGYGFIESPEFDGDVYLSADEKKGYKAGQTVRFTLVRRADGKPQAKDLRSGLKEDTFVPREPREPNAKRQKKEKDELGEHLGDFKGRIKSYSEKNKYGFIECEEIAAMGYQDVFLHADDKCGYRTEEIVSFSAFLSAEGKPQAKNLITDDDKVIGQFTGEIKSFVASTNYGFISCPEIVAQGYQDVYLRGEQKKEFQVG